MLMTYIVSIFVNFLFDRYSAHKMYQIIEKKYDINYDRFAGIKINLWNVFIPGLVLLEICEMDEVCNNYCCYLLDHGLIFEIKNDSNYSQNNNFCFSDIEHDDNTCDKNNFEVVDRNKSELKEPLLIDNKPKTKILKREKKK